MKMPAAKNHPYANGFSRKANGHEREDRDRLANKVANEKLDLMEQEINGQAQTGRSQQAEVFHDTSAQGAHNGRQDDEPILIYDTQNNTSIAQTAKDQFAAALLRLQSGLDASTKRLEEVEKRVESIAAQQRQQQQSRPSQGTSTSKKTNWMMFSKNGHLNTLIYLSWPVLVFVAMRALERRSLLRKLE